MLETSGRHPDLPTRNQRSGFALFAVLATMVFVFAMVTAIVRVLNLQADEISAQLDAFQQETLMRSAADRASFMMDREPEYARESWAPAGAQEVSSVEIRIVDRDDREVAITLKMATQVGALSQPLKMHTYRIESGYAIPL